MKLYRLARELAEKTLPQPVLVILFLIYLLLGLYAWMVFLLFLMAGVQEGYAFTFDVLGGFFDLFGVSYSRWIHGALALGTIILVVHYLARFMAYVQEQREKKRFGARIRDILYPDQSELRHLMEVFKASGDLAISERLRRKLEERKLEEELEKLRREKLEEERRRVEEEERQRLEPTKMRSATIEERSEIIEKLRRLREKRERETE